MSLIFMASFISVVNFRVFLFLHNIFLK
jgi:hypothetical protein